MLHRWLEVSSSFHDDVFVTSLCLDLAVRQRASEVRNNWGRAPFSELSPFLFPFFPRPGELENYRFYGL